MTALIPSSANAYAADADLVGESVRSKPATAAP
jgi:hypothetical protein